MLWLNASALPRSSRDTDTRGRPQSQHRFAELFEQVFHGLARREERRLVLVFEQAREDRQHLAEAGFLRVIERVALMAMKETKASTAKLPIEGPAHFSEK